MIHQNLRKRFLHSLNSTISKKTRYLTRLTRLVSVLAFISSTFADNLCRNVQPILLSVCSPINVSWTFTHRGCRKLKTEARPIARPDDPSVLVSGADCRMMAFESIQQATKLWIKGREFTVAKLLGPQYASEAPKYDGGALAIFRLAPQVRLMNVRRNSTVSLHSWEY